MHCFVCRFPSFWRRPKLPRYTIVQTVFKLGSNRTAFPSTAFALVSYMGFSKAAWPLLFSWTEHPVYWVLGAVLLMRTLISYTLTFFQKQQNRTQTQYINTWVITVNGWYNLKILRNHNSSNLNNFHYLIKYFFSVPLILSSLLATPISHILGCLKLSTIPWFLLPSFLIFFLLMLHI